MLKKYSKKVIFVSVLLIVFFMFSSVVFASYKYTLYKVGDTVMEYSGVKLKGDIHIKNVHYSQYYRGEIEYQLQKKGLFGYTNVGERQRISTYNKTVDVAYWKSNSNTEYRGFIELTEADSPTRFSNIYGYLSVGDKDHQ